MFGLVDKEGEFDKLFVLSKRAAFWDWVQQCNVRSVFNRDLGENVEV